MVWEVSLVGEKGQIIAPTFTGNQCFLLLGPLFGKAVGRGAYHNRYKQLPSSKRHVEICLEIGSEGTLLRLP